MATKANKTKSKRRATAKSKTKPARSKPLLAEIAQVRTAKPRRKARKGCPDSVELALPYNPALMMIGVMRRLIGVYAELPGRLAQCRSPMDLCLEQARFTQRVFTECQPKASG